MRTISETEKEMLESKNVCSGFDFSITRDLAKRMGSKRVIFTGMGSSVIFPGKNAKNRALKLGISNKVEVYPSSDLFQYDDFSDTFLFLCSNSGRTRETVFLQECAKKRGAICVAVTAVADSPLAQRCEEKIILSCGFEKGVVATKSMVEQGLICESLIFNSARLQGKNIDFRQLKKDLIDAGEKMARNINFKFDKPLLKSLGLHPHYYFIGPDNGVAEEIALKTQEIIRKPATFYAGTQILHGPAEAINGGCIVVLESLEFYAPYYAYFREFAEKTNCVLFCTDWVLEGNPESTFKNYCLLSAGWSLLRNIANYLGIDIDHPQIISKVSTQ